MGDDEKPPEMDEKATSVRVTQSQSENRFVTVVA